MRAPLILACAMGLAACATPPSQPSSQTCRTGGVETSVGGRAILGAGSDGFISDADIILGTRITPGSTNCTTVGGSIRN